MSRKSLINLMTAPPNEPNENFLYYLTTGIEYLNKIQKKPSSKYYKPSSMNCQRQMYYIRTGANEDVFTTTYEGIEIAKTGTLRHNEIQDTLIQLNGLTHSYWKYIDVGVFVKELQSRGYCKYLECIGKRNNETHFIEHQLKLSFMCDGVLWNKTDDEYYLFEFKNQVSKKAMGKKHIDPEHLNQVVCYCLCLELNKVIMLYEDRNLCTLYCPPVVKITDEMKEAVRKTLIQTEEMVENHYLPPMVVSQSICKWCNYKGQCEKDGG